MADALGVLLLTWNNAFYRYGDLDLNELDKCLSRNFPVIKAFRLRHINSFCLEDEAVAGALFEGFLNALRLAGTTTKSPVAAAKALHLLAPAFFPLWDVTIAKHYKSYWYHSHNGAERYLFFWKVARALAQREASSFEDETETLLKIFDEFNYAKFTKQWL